MSDEDFFKNEMTISITIGDFHKEVTFDCQSEEEFWEMKNSVSSEVRGEYLHNERQKDEFWRLLGG